MSPTEEKNISEIILVVAASANNAIGKNNKLLWRLPNDLKFFKNTTWGMPIIMGRKTFESINKPLPGRINIVMTTQPSWNAPGVKVAPTAHEALQIAAQTHCKQIFIIGGAEIYNAFLPIAHKIYLTKVHSVIADADTFFPVINEAKWQMISNKDFVADDKHAYPYSFQIWKIKTHH